MNTELYLIRHGQTDGNVYDIYQGHTDTPINKLGCLQAEFLRDRFQNIKLDKIFASPLIRTFKTAEILNEYHNLEIKTDKRFMELFGGDLEGIPFPEIAVKYPEVENVWITKIYEFAAPNGESMRELYSRISTAINETVEANKGKSIAIVTHGCPIKNYLTYIHGYSIENIDKIQWAGNTAVSKIIFDNDLKPHVEYINDCSHLRPEHISSFNQEGIFNEDTCG